MPDLMDYLEWRGDLTLAEAPLCEVDNLILCLLAYVDLDGIVGREGKGVTVRAAAAEYFFSRPTTEERPLGYMIPGDILTLLRRVAHTRRFRDLRLFGYVSETCEAEETQFSAVTVELSEEAVFVAYRGTDDSLVGWREDLNLSCMEVIPAQHRAVAYLDELPLPPDTAIYVGGHSKGGNLALYAALHASEGVRRRIKRVYANDAPGFLTAVSESATYRELEGRITRLLPEDSLVGLLLEHGEEYTVVKSSRRGLCQHDGLSWEVLGGSFIRAEGLSPAGLRHDRVLRSRIESMTIPERRELIRLLFSLLESTGAKTITELRSGGFRNALALMRHVRALPRTEQETAGYLWEKLTGKGTEEKGASHAEDRDGRTSQSSTTRQKRPTHHRGRVKCSLFPLLLP